MAEQIKRIVIVGGGSAGWLTAGVLASEHRVVEGGPLEVVLLESPNVRTIGVGEGTWPSMRDTLRRMGVSESAFVGECNAAFKQASRFQSWVSGDPDDVYYHPFSAPQGYGEVDLVPDWLRSGDGVSFADWVSFQPLLCEQGKAPKQMVTPEFAAVANYAYHLDAEKFGEFLRKHCVGTLGVRHLQAHVTAVRPAENGDIAGLETTELGLVSGDLFIDCTGFSALLLGGHYQVPYHSVTSKLFCDRAVAVQVPYASSTQAIASCTLSTAQSAGWIWDIGLQTRRGVGYVYSSAHASPEQAQEALRHHIRNTGGDARGLELREIALNPGYRQTFWHRNCVAVGLSAGFVEPLEASALVMIELSARMLADDLPPNRALMDEVALRFNRHFSYRWGRIVDFLKLHYLLSRRDDSDFWRDNREPGTIPERLQNLLELWRFRSPNSRDFPEIEEIFPAASYQYVLYGMGFRPEATKQRKRLDNPDLAARARLELDQSRRKFMTGLPSHRDLIEQIRLKGLPRV